jgi:NADH-quinone oxidoreductase subunit M
VEARLMSGILLLPALFLPLLAALFLATGKGSAEQSGNWSRIFAWVYAAVATLTACAALTAQGGLSLAAPMMRLGVSGCEFEPRLLLDGRGALFLLLLGLCPPVVFALVRTAGRSQNVCAWTLIFGLAGVFLADSLVLFYLFWEAALIAVYFWIGLHGRRNRFGGEVYPALLRFVLFTLAGSLPMLASIAAVCAANFRDPGLRGLAATVSQLPDGARAWVFLGFLLGFAVKLPLFGFHGWLRDTYNIAPPACRALLSAAMSKMGAFGLILILAPAFPVEMARFAPALLTLAAIGAVYGGVLMLAQDRLLDMLAYASLSHLSILALGVFASASVSLDAGAASTTGLSGATMLVFSHALIMALLFSLDARALRDGSAGASPDRLRLAGLRARQPRLFAFLLLAVFASASLPGLNNFPGEVLVLFAAYQVSPWLALSAGLGALIGAAALVRLLHNVWLGKPDNVNDDPADDSQDPATEAAPDLNRSEISVALALSLLWLVVGLYPMLLLDPIERAFSLINALGWTG